MLDTTIWSLTTAKYGRDIEKITNVHVVFIYESVVNPTIQTMNVAYHTGIADS